MLALAASYLAIAPATNPTLRPLDIDAKRPPFDVGPANVDVPMHNLERFIKAEEDFRASLASITACDGSSSTPCQGDLIGELCNATVDALPTLGFATVVDLLTAYTGMETNLSNAFTASGVSSGIIPGHHLIGIVAMNELLGAYDAHTMADERDAAVGTMIVTAANRASGPLQPGASDRSLVGGAELHGAVWTYFGSFGAIVPATLWPMVDVLCGRIFNMIGYSDCIHGVGHAAFNDALVTVGGAAKSGSGPCTYFQSYSLSYSGKVVRHALATIAAAPHRGLTVEASRGLYMAAAEYASAKMAAAPPLDTPTTMPPAGALDWTYFRFSGDPTAPNVTLGCPYQSAFTFGCFYWQFQALRTEAKTNPAIKFTIDSVVADCLAHEMLDEKTRRACLAGSLGAWALDPTTRPTADDYATYLDTCEALSPTPRRDACIAGLAWAFGDAKRSGDMTLVGAGQPLVTGPSMCDVMQAQNRSVDALGLCRASWVQCTAPGWCTSPDDYLDEMAAVLYA